MEKAFSARKLAILMCLSPNIMLGWSTSVDAKSQPVACIKTVARGLLPVANDPAERFTAKVRGDNALCRGGDNATKYQHTPWVDWQNYYSTGDENSEVEKSWFIPKFLSHITDNGRGLDGALLDLEYQRIELIKFNLFDQSTYEEFVKSGNDRVTKRWPEMRLPSDHPAFRQIDSNPEKQLCTGSLVTHRNLSGICNDLINPLMGSTGMPFSRNVSFESTFPRLGNNEITKNRHGDRLDLLKPDPQLISQKLFSRQQSSNNGCNVGFGDENYSADANCDYIKAPHFNVLAAFWIQFMTHDWFSHTVEGRNTDQLNITGCDSEEAQTLGCRKGDRIEPSLYAQTSSPDSFDYGEKSFLTRAPKTTRNTVTAWWDASQLYGFDQVSAQRVARDSEDPAKLQLNDGLLPLLPQCKSYSADCPVQPHWNGQEVAAFPDNWNIGLSFFHNLFTREHNRFVTYFRQLQKNDPDGDSGLRNPENPEHVITYKEVTDERLFQVTRLIIAAEIAKIHTIEWTTQLLYDEPLFIAMNSNWSGLFNLKESRVSKIVRKITGKEEGLLTRASDKIASWLNKSDKRSASTGWYSVFASGAGILGQGNKHNKGILWWRKDTWNVSNLETDVNGGTNHFGSPFNFPEEFPSVYRLHPMVPDLLELRDTKNPNDIAFKIPVADMIRGDATEHMQKHGLDNWALSMGRQRLGLLTLHNQPIFLQNLPMPHLDSETQKLDIAALDIIRDRERGVPRFNELRRQIGLQHLTSFDDFIDQHLDEDSAQRKNQLATIQQLREVYGTHICDERKIISIASKNRIEDSDGNIHYTEITDCLGQPHGTEVDNIEDVDSIVGILAEYTRPHGFAISETQFQLFILNASRRLFSDRFFTSSYRPEFYSNAGFSWVQNNGPDDKDDCPYDLTKQPDGKKACLEPEKVNRHKVPVSPLKRLIIRNIPQLKNELLSVKNAFDPWARDRGHYYSLDWEPREDAACKDPAFKCEGGLMQ